MLVFSCQDNDISQNYQRGEIDSLKLIIGDKNTEIYHLKKKIKEREKIIYKNVHDPNEYHFAQDLSKKYHKVPKDVLYYIALNYPKYSIPDLDLFRSSITDTSEIKYLPYYCSGDYNNDGIIDHAITIGYHSILNSRKHYNYMTLVINGSENGLYEPMPKPSESWWIGNGYIGETLRSRTFDEIRKEFPLRIEKTEISNTSILVYTETSISCLYWKNDNYKSVSLFVD